MPNPFRLLTFGGLTLLDDSGATVVEQRRRLALLALVAASGDRGTSRDRLVAGLSPDSSTESAQHALQQLIYYLRKHVGPHVFLGTDPLRLNPDVITSDFLDFERALDEGRLTDAAAMYRGPFLDGFHLGDSTEFEEWAAAERARLGARHLDNLIRIADQAEARGELDRALASWREVTRLDPLTGRGALRFMRVLAATGDGSGALRHAQQHAALVRAELGSGPDPEVLAFADRLRENGSLATTPPPAPDGPAAQPRPGQHHGRLSPRWGRLGVVAVLLAAIAYAVIVGFRATLDPLELESTDQLLVGEFEAPPRDSLAARALSEALRSSLSESRAIRIVSRAELDQALQRMELPVTTRLLAPIVAELTARNGYEAVLAGAITPLGQGYVVSARLMAADGRELAALSESASSADALISAVGRLGSQLRRLVGESAKVLDSVPPLWQVTTRSLRALELFSQAQRVSGVEGSEPPRVMALLHQALHEDSTFAMAHRRIGMAYLNLGRTRDGVRALRAAERFSDRLTEVERLTALSSLHGYLRQHPLALEEAAAILRREPENGWAKIKMVWEYLFTERYAEAEAYIRGMGGTFPRPALWPDLRQLQGHGAEALDSARASYRLSEDGIGMRGRPAARRRLARFHAANFAVDSADYWSRPLPGGDGGTPRIFVSALLSRGRLREAFAARGVRPRGRERVASPPGIAFVDEALAALATALLTSDRAAASRRLDAVLADSAYRVMDPADRPVRPLIALALAGRVEEARRELDGIERAADADVRAARHPELFLARGAVAMAERRWPDAIADFRRASSEVNWGSEDACRVCALPWLGRAFDLANRPDSAAAVLERYLSTGDSYRDVVDATWRAISLRRLGELHAQLGDTARALGRLAEFTELWKGADPELQPQVVEAHRRILELGRGTRTIR